MREGGKHSGILGKRNKSTHRVTVQYSYMYMYLFSDVTALP